MISRAPTPTSVPGKQAKRSRRRGKDCFEFLNSGTDPRLPTCASAPLGRVPQERNSRWIPLGGGVRSSGGHRNRGPFPACGFSPMNPERSFRPPAFGREGSGGSDWKSAAITYPLPTCWTVCQKTVRKSIETASGIQGAKRKRRGLHELSDRPTGAKPVARIPAGLEGSPGEASWNLCPIKHPTCKRTFGRRSGEGHVDMVVRIKSGADPMPTLGPDQYKRCFRGWLQPWRTGAPATTSCRSPNRGVDHPAFWWRALPSAAKSRSTCAARSPGLIASTRSKQAMASSAAAASSARVPRMNSVRVCSLSFR